MYENIYNNSNGFFGYTSDGNPHDCGNGFRIVRVYKNLEDNTYTLRLTSTYGDSEIIHDFPRGHLDKRYIGELQEKGFSVSQDNFPIFTKAFFKTEKTYLKNNPVCYNHKYVGWQKVNINGKDEILFKSFGKGGNYPSEYKGNLDIEPQGTLQGQIDMIKSEVEGNTPLEAVLAIGASAILNGYIGELVQTDTLIVHLVGDSSQGKTTAARLAVSVAGSSDVRKSSLFKSWNATYNGIITRMQGNHGMPVAFDEISKFRGKDMSDVVYVLTDGREKDKCNKDGEMKLVKAVDSWHTVIISTGEASLLNKCSENTGLKVRVIELEDVFTKSAKNADAIKKSVSENYGFIAPFLASALSKIGQDKLVRQHEKYKNRFIELCGNLKLIDRIAGNIAMFILSADLLNKALKLNLNVKKIVSYFVANVKANNANKDMADEALAKIIEFTNVHRKNFMIKCKKIFKRFQIDPNYNITTERGLDKVEKIMEEEATASECWGKIIDGSCLNDTNIDIQILFYKERFNKIIKELGFEDAKVVIKKLKEKGYLDHETGKTYRKRKIRSTDPANTHTIVINIPRCDDMESDEDDSLTTAESVADETEGTEDIKNTKKAFDKILEFDDCDGNIILHDDCDEDDDRELKDVG